MDLPEWYHNLYAWQHILLKHRNPWSVRQGPVDNNTLSWMGPCQTGQGGSWTGPGLLASTWASHSESPEKLEGCPGDTQ